MALRILYAGHRNTLGKLSADGFTQANPVNAGNTVGTVVVTATPSTTLANQVNEKGVLGGTVAFTRPEIGNDVIGGAPVDPAAWPTNGGYVPLGLFINDAVGNAFENTPGVASGRAPYTSGMGTYAVDVYETTDAGGGTLTYAPGDLLYASCNGLLTKVSADSLEAAYAKTPTVVGVVKQAPGAGVTELILDQRI